MSKQSFSTNKQRILIFGGTGQIGTVAVDRLAKKFKVIAPTSKEVDVTDRKVAEEFILKSEPDRILYIAGYTNTDGAREEPGKAFWLNAGAVLHLTFIAAKHKIPFHYLSTELVFNGEKSKKPYTEKDAPDPLLTNGKTKQLGELATLNASKANCVIRLIMCYSPIYERKGDLARLTVNKLKSGQEFSATDDQLCNPIYVNHLVDAISMILESKESGIFHLGATDFTTPYEFARKIARKLKLDENLVKPVKFADFSKTRPELRPKDQWLDTKKFRTTFGEGVLKSIDEGISDFVRDYKKYNK